MRRLSIGAFSLMLLPLALLPGLRLAWAQAAFEADITFPEQRDAVSPPVLRALGNQVTSLPRTVALPAIDDLDVHLVVNPNALAARDECVLELDVTINDVPAGTLTVHAGDATVDQFLRPAQQVLPVMDGANANYTFVLTVAAAPPANCGSVTLPFRQSKWHLEVEDQAGNARPRGSIGGPYTVDEGSTLAMAAQGTDPEGEIVTFSWDFDGDDLFDDGDGPNALFDAALIQGPATPTIKLKLSDAGGATRVLETAVTVNNVAPTFDAQVRPAHIAVLDVLYSFDPVVHDPCPLDHFTFGLLRKPNGMNLREDGRIEWTPTADQVDQSFPVKLKVQDDAGDSSLLEWDVRVVSDPNTPTVTAGDDRTTDPGCVELSCSGSDPRGRDLAYHWELVQGPEPVVFRDQEAPVTTVVVGLAGNYRFSCVAKEQVPEVDVPLTSPPDEVVLTVNNLTPTADPGFPISGTTKKNVTLDGRRSVDPNNDGLRYRWEQTSGESVRIAGFSNPMTSFTPQATDIYCFTLTVTDAGGLASDPAPICVVVNEPGDPEHCADDTDCRADNGRCRPVAGELFSRCEPFLESDYNPVAWAGEDQWAVVGDNVSLKGMRSYDPDGQALEEYVWSPCSPLAEQAVLNGQGTMMPTFVPQTAGRYCWSLVVQDASGHHSIPDEVQVMVETPENRAPWAEAGPGITARVGDDVVLDGSQSRDPDGNPLTFQWKQLRGPAVALDNAAVPVAHFCASIPGIYQFQLDVNDGKTSGTLDDVWVTVTSACNKAPQAKAGVDFTVLTDDGSGEDSFDDRAVLDGRQTFDPDPSPLLNGALWDGLKLQWVQVGGMPVDLQGPFTRRPMFRTTKWGVYTFRLFARDAYTKTEDPHGAAAPACWLPAWSLPDDVVVVVNDRVGAANGNNVPVADAGPDLQDCLLGEDCKLDGAGSSDADGDALHFRWTQLGGTPLALADKDTAAPHFQADALGEWDFRLVVNDGYIDSQADQVKIKVRPNDNTAPVCRAGQDQPSVKIGEVVTLNGCGSADQNGDRLTFIWTKQDGPELPDFAQGTGQESCKATFTAPAVEVDTPITFQLVVNDGRVDCAEPDSVVVTVLKKIQNCEPGAFLSDGCACPDGQVGKLYCAADGMGAAPCTECHATCACVANEEDACHCDNGGVGKRTCAADCLSWSACTDCVLETEGSGGEGTDGGGGGGSGCAVVAGPPASTSLLLLALGGIGLVLLRRR